MYRLKGRNLLDRQDSRDSDGKGVRLSSDSTPPEMSTQTSTESGDSVDGLTGSKPLNPDDSLRFNPDELPDGYSFSPQRIQSKNGSGEEGVGECPVRDAEYIGSFSVVGEDQNSRAEYVRNQLAEMRGQTRTKPVLLIISLSGIKVCSSNGESVYMAHALKRISYATCDPDNRQFSFLAREPKGHTSIQYCHAFVTSTPEQAEELNNIVGNAFKMAYAYQRQSEQQQQPTFHELIEQQLEEQRNKMEQLQEEKQKELQEKLKLISTATISDRVKERKERRKEELEQLERERAEALLQGRDRTKWAKQVAGKSKHKTPFSEELQRHSMYAGSTPNKQNGSLRSSPASVSMSALREAFEASDHRSHGSPVMAMKETIDSHFNGSLNKSNFVNDSVDGETYLYPVVSDEPHPADDDFNETTQQNSNMINRPLPTLPHSEEKKQRKASKSKKSSESSSSSSSSRRSFISNSKSDDSPGGAGSPVELGNGQYHLSTLRPPSVQYQNENLHQNPLDVAGVYAGPLTPKKYDSLRKIDPSGHMEDEEQLKQHTWYQAGIPREIALEILLQQEIGSFIVRDSTTHPGCYALSVKVPKFENPAGISHYLIHRTSSGGVKLKGLDKEWPNLMALVIHHTVMPEMLACTLRLPRNSNNPAFNEIERDEKEEDEDYQKLSDFSTMMAELKKV